MTSRQKSRMDIRKSKEDTGISPRFSVILCTYNRCNLVLSALASLRRQTLPYNQFEVIVIDNGSSDGTLSAMQAYVSARQERNPEDMWHVQCLYEPQNGLAYARNTGLMAASGEIAVFLDDDALADPHFLERLLRAYEETEADAVGGRVEIRWEAKQPHWLTGDLLEQLGHYAPAGTRIQLQPFTSFSGTNFSVKIEALRAIGYFSPFLSKRLHLPASTEVSDLCCRLHFAGYKLWYEPGAVVAHRVPAARLVRPFFVGRAYWQGRSEVLAQYAGAKHNGMSRNTAFLLRAAFLDLREIVYLSLIHRPLLWLAGKSTNERLLAAMGQARSLGRLQQHLQFLEHAPTELTTTPVLLVRAAEPDPTAELLAKSLNLQDVHCTLGITDIPLSWLWQHRTSHEQPGGILHVYRPGAFHLSYRQRQRLNFRLWLAQHWDIPIVTTDAGGCWQNNVSLRFLSRRILERKLLHRSAIILGYTRQPEQLYPNKKIRRRVRCLPHPGFRGYYTEPKAASEARKQLGLPVDASYVYLCFAPAHSEHELLLLIAAFREMLKDQRQQEAAEQQIPQLLLVGVPDDKRMPMRVLKQAARNPAIHLSMANPQQEDIPFYLGAANAVVLPHFARHNAGMLETALLAISYERVVVAPDLPRFRGMLPPRASILYAAGSRQSLMRALIKAQTLKFSLTEKEAAALDAESGWGQYAHRLAQIYREILVSVPSSGS